MVAFSKAPPAMASMDGDIRDVRPLYRVLSEAEQWTADQLAHRPNTHHSSVRPGANAHR
jgi:hypothetical protein